MEVKKNTELSIRMNQTLKEKHDADLPDTERIAMWMSQLARNTPPGLRDVIWGKSRNINFAIASIIAASYESIEKQIAPQRSRRL